MWSSFSVGAGADDGWTTPRLRESLALRIADHWLKYRPTMSAALQKLERFETSVNQAADLTLDAPADFGVTLLQGAEVL
jgi:hypothetical protein